MISRGKTLVKMAIEKEGLEITKKNSPETTTKTQYDTTVMPGKNYRYEKTLDWLIKSKFELYPNIASINKNELVESRDNIEGLDAKDLINDNAGLPANSNNGKDEVANRNKRVDIEVGHEVISDSCPSISSVELPVADKIEIPNNTILKMLSKYYEEPRQNNNSVRSSPELIKHDENKLSRTFSKNDKIRILQNVLVVKAKDTHEQHDTDECLSSKQSSKAIDKVNSKVCQNIQTNLDINKTEPNSNCDSDDSRDRDYCMSGNSCESTEYSNNSGTECSNNSGRCTKSGETKARSHLHSQLFAEKIKNEQEKRKRIIRCKYCSGDIATKNFMRHVKRNHSDQHEVQKLFEFPKNSKERRLGLNMLRNATNFDLYINEGIIRPKRRGNISDSGQSSNNYNPCAYCKGLFSKEYLRRHVKICKVLRSSDEGKNKNNALSCSQTVVACAIDPTNVISTLDVKQKVYDLMKPDEIALEAKKDILIAHFGNSYLKRHKREHMAYACSNRMRELSRLLINFRQISNNQNLALKDLITPIHFDMVITAVRNISGYNAFTKTFTSPSLAMHLGTSLKKVCEELVHLIYKKGAGFQSKSKEESTIWLKNIKQFKTLIESRWTIELGSLANKDLQEKRWCKPLLLPLVSDVKIFREGALNIAKKCENLFYNNQDTVVIYKEFIQCTLSLLILFNRRRIGDVQYLKIKDYKMDKKSCCTDFNAVLTETEKFLTSKYKRVINSGKGSRAVVILIPEILSRFIDLLLEKRYKYIPTDNEYIFAMPGSKIKWGKGDVAIRTIAKKAKVENIQCISSNKLRKQIATVMQILNLSNDEAKQFSSFMGHTQKTHEEFYELPVDIYQTAKVSKLLLMMEKGTIPAEYKGKSLSQIHFDCNLEYAEEDDINGLNMENDGSDIATNVILKQMDLRQSPTHENTPRTPTEIKETVKRKASDTDTDENGINIIEKKKKILKKKGWSPEEINLINNTFKIYIQKEIFPPTQDMQEFIKKTHSKRSVPMIRSKIQHLIKCMKKNQS